MKTEKKTMACLLLVSALTAVSAQAGNDELYYAIGGGQPIADASTNRSSTFKLGIGGSWDANLTCGNFDMGLSVENQLNGIKGEFKNLMGNVINAATGVVASLPALAIQRINPALYDLLQNGVLQATEEFNMSVASCEEVVTEVMSNSETDMWRQFSNTELWRQEGSTGTADPLDVEERIEAGEGQDNGVTWVAGTQRAGKSQPPVEIIGDTVRAGYNVLLNRAPDNTLSMVGSCGGAPLCQAFDAPQRQAEWAISILGERLIRTCKGCKPMETQSGMGLSRALLTVKKDIQTKLTALVASANAPSKSQLDEVSGGPALKVTRRVIEAIRDEKPTERGALVVRLAGEMAMSRTMEFALMTRRSLLAGMKEPNIGSYEPAQKYLHQAVAELDKEIENMLFEMDVRGKLAGNATYILLQRSAARATVPLIEKRPDSSMESGGVLK